MNANPNLITESGREHLSLADRAGLLAADDINLQLARPQFDRARTETWHQVHQFNQLRGSIYACIRDARNPAATEKSWGILNLSRIECLLLAWRRGGVVEYDRVKRLAYPQHKVT